MKNILLIVLIYIGFVPLIEGRADEVIVDGIDDKSYSIVSHYDIQINAPAAKVWPHLNNLKSWMTDFDLSTVSGEPGEIGEVLRLYPQQNFLIQRLFAVPENILVFSNLPVTFNNETGHGQTIISVNENNGITLVNLTMARYFTWHGKGSNPLKQTRLTQQFQENAKNQWEKRFLATLKNCQNNKKHPASKITPLKHC